jgi:hypothetical protein
MALFGRGGKIAHFVSFAEAPATRKRGVAYPLAIVADFSKGRSSSGPVIAK